MRTRCGNVAIHGQTGGAKCLARQLSVWPAQHFCWCMSGKQANRTRAISFCCKPSTCWSQISCFFKSDYQGGPAKARYNTASIWCMDTWAVAGVADALAKTAANANVWPEIGLMSEFTNQNLFKRQRTTKHLRSNWSKYVTYFMCSLRLYFKLIFSSTRNGPNTTPIAVFTCWFVVVADSVNDPALGAPTSKNFSWRWAFTWQVAQCSDALQISGICVLCLVRSRVRHTTSKELNNFQQMKTVEIFTYFEINKYVCIYIYVSSPRSPVLHWKEPRISFWPIGAIHCASPCAPGNQHEEHELSKNQHWVQFRIWMVNTSPCPPHPPLSQHGRIITDATWHSHQKQRMKTHVFPSTCIVDKWFLPSFPSHGPAPQVRWVVFCRLQHLQPNFAAKTPLGVAEPWDKTTKKGVGKRSNWAMKKGPLVSGFIQLCGGNKNKPIKGSLS